VGDPLVLAYTGTVIAAVPVLAYFISDTVNVLRRMTHVRATRAVGSIK